MKLIEEEQLLTACCRKRPSTRILLDALLSKEISKNEAIAMFLNYLSDGEVEEVLRDNEVIPSDIPRARGGNTR